jgi:hypothetical protein
MPSEAGALAADQGVPLAKDQCTSRQLTMPTGRECPSTTGMQDTGCVMNSLIASATEAAGVKVIAA